MTKYTEEQTKEYAIQQNNWLVYLLEQKGIKVETQGEYHKFELPDNKGKYALKGNTECSKLAGNEWVNMNRKELVELIAPSKKLSLNSSKTSTLSTTPTKSTLTTYSSDEDLSNLLDEVEHTRGEIKEHDKNIQQSNQNIQQSNQNIEHSKKVIEWGNKEIERLNNEIKETDKKYQEKVGKIMKDLETDTKKIIKILKEPSNKKGGCSIF